MSGEGGADEEGFSEEAVGNVRVDVDRPFVLFVGLSGFLVVVSLSHGGRVNPIK